MEELKKKMKEEKSRKERKEPVPYQIKEFTLDSEVGPKLATIQERQGSIRTSLKFHKVNEDNIDEDQDVEKIRKKLLRKYASVFKRDLGKEDRVHMDPVKVELIDESKVMGNCMIPTETPRHLQEAVAEELARMLKAGCLEPVHHPTTTTSRAFFVQKHTKDGSN